MEREADYWEIFTHTGRVEDYLTYRRQAFGNRRSGNVTAW